MPSFFDELGQDIVDHPEFKKDLKILENHVAAYPHDYAGIEPGVVKRMGESANRLAFADQVDFRRTASHILDLLEKILPPAPHPDHDLGVRFITMQRDLIRENGGI